MDAEFPTVVSFLSHQELRLGRWRRFSFALGNAHSEFCELGLQFFEGEGLLSGSVHVLRERSDGLCCDDFRSGIAAVNGEPESDDPGSVEFMS
jgi:hypothetical protein